MTLVIRDVREHELDSVLALNNAVGPRILALDSSRMLVLHPCILFPRGRSRWRDCRFLIALCETAAYASPNFSGFASASEFVYRSHRHRRTVSRLGLGRILLRRDQLPKCAFRCLPARFSWSHVTMSPCFSMAPGFNEVGQQVMPGVGRTVSLLAKALCSHEFVRDTYLTAGTGELPDLPWLAERSEARVSERGARATGS
jgi:hypothetical protein